MCLYGVTVTLILVTRTTLRNTHLIGLIDEIDEDLGTINAWSRSPQRYLNRWISTRGQPISYSEHKNGSRDNRGRTK